MLRWAYWTALGFWIGVRVVISDWHRRLVQLWRTWYGTTMLFAALGCGAGIVVFSVAALQGAILFAAVGGLIGVLGAIGLLALQRSRSRFHLQEVKIAFGGNEATFVINARYRKVAWQLFVETMTRIATQPLNPEQGTTREALSSLYSLFQTSRDLLKEMEPTPTTEGNTVEMLALEMLNSHLRPFLTRWHPRLANYEQQHPTSRESDWEGIAQCRADLNDIRNALLGYAKSLGQLAGIQQLERFFTEEMVTVAPAPTSRAGD